MLNFCFVLVNVVGGVVTVFVISLITAVIVTFVIGDSVCVATIV